MAAAAAAAAVGAGAGLAAAVRMEERWGAVAAGGDGWKGGWVGGAVHTS